MTASNLNTTVPKNGLAIGSSFWTRAFLEETGIQQEKITEENTGKYSLTELPGILAKQDNEIDRYLILLGNISEKSGALEPESFFSIVNSFKELSFIPLLLLKEGHFAAKKDIGTIIEALSRTQLSDSMIAKILSTVQVRFDQVDVRDRLTLYNNITRDTYKIDGIKALPLQHLTSQQLLQLCHKINADTYKVETVPLFIQKKRCSCGLAGTPSLLKTCFE